MITTIEKLSPGDRFKVPTLDGLQGRLIHSNECRACVKLDNRSSSVDWSLKVPVVKINEENEMAKKKAAGAAAAVAKKATTKKKPAPKKVAGSPSKKRKDREKNNKCGCGCGTMVAGRFKQGHDSTFKSRVKKIHREQMTWKDLKKILGEDGKYALKGYQTAVKEYSE